MQIPSRIIEKPPSPDLIPGVTDENVFGVTIDDLDRSLRRIEGGEVLDPHDTKSMRVLRILESARYRELRNLAISRNH